MLFYTARYYDPGIGRFVSADTIVPGAGSLTVAPNDATALAAWGQAGPAANPQQLNRYTYVLNNPLKSGDPTGHCIPGPFLVWCAVVVGSFITEVVIPAVVGAAVIAAAAEAGKQLGEAARAANAQEQADAKQEPLSVDDYLSGTKRVKNDKTKIHTKQGDINDANDDFDRLTAGQEVKTYPDGTRSAKLPVGTTVTVRPKSSTGNPQTGAVPPKEDGYPTLDIKPPSGKITKVRYVP